MKINSLLVRSPGCRCFFSMVAILGLAAGGGCSSRSVGGTGEDAAVAQRDSTVADDGVVADASPNTDGGYYWCSCPDGPDPGPEDPVLSFHPCVPPMQFGCKAMLCDPDQREECPEGHTCEECAAAACCICAACVSACLFTRPTQGPLPEYLKLSHTRGAVGDPSTVSIEGFPFYIGALGYSVRLGLSGPELRNVNGGLCSMEVEMDGREEGVAPVWVSSYGFYEPRILAGFFFWLHNPDEWEECIQPGYPCAENTPCCETDDVPMKCESGRCVHAQIRPGVTILENNVASAKIEVITP